MKINSIILIVILFFVSESCVQKSYTKIVMITLKVTGKKDIKTVGIRGEGKPLSWDKDFEMIPVVKDSLYRATITTLTGYKFTDIKFTVDGVLELKSKPSRKLFFNNKDTTFYNAMFDSVQSANP
ncbi:MAG: hypothetical protein NVSMB45_18690 [Ginsengibacter sp.]